MPNDIYGHHPPMAHGDTALCDTIGVPYLEVLQNITDVIKQAS